MSKAADRSSKMSTEDLEADLASLRASVTESRAVSVEWLLLKPYCLLSRRLFCARNKVRLNKTRSSVFAMNSRRDTGLSFSKRAGFREFFFLAVGLSEPA